MNTRLSCRYTDLDAAAARKALDALSASVGEPGGLVDRVLRANAAAPHPLKPIAHATPKATRDAGLRFLSRTARLRAFADPPFDGTLFLDDDAVPCGRLEPVLLLRGDSFHSPLTKGGEGNARHLLLLMSGDV